MVHQAVILSALGLAGNVMAAPAAMRAENHARRVLTDDSSVVQPPMPPGPIVTPNIPMDIPIDVPVDDVEKRKIGTELIKSLVNGLGIGGGSAGSEEALDGGEEPAEKLKRATQGYSDAEKRKIGTELIKSLVNGLGIGGGSAGSEEALDGGEEPAEKLKRAMNGYSDAEKRKIGTELIKSLVNGLGIGGGTAGSTEALDDGEGEEAAEKRSVDSFTDAEKRKVGGKLVETGQELLKGLATGLGIGGGTAGTEEALDSGEEPAEKLKRAMDGFSDAEKRKVGGKLIETGQELLKGLATGIGIGGGTAGTEEALDDGGEEPAEKRSVDSFTDAEKRKVGGKLIETGQELLKGLATGLGIGGGTAGTEEALDSGEEPAEKRAFNDLTDAEKRKVGGKIVETGQELLKGLATGLGIGGGTAGTEEALDDGGEEPAEKLKRAINTYSDAEKRKIGGKLIETGTELLKGLATGVGIGGGTAGTEEALDDGGEEPAEKLKRAMSAYSDAEKRKIGGKLIETGTELLKGLATGVGIGGGTAGTEEALDDGGEEGAEEPAEKKRIVMPPGGPIPTPGDFPIMDDELYTTLADTQE